MSDYDIHNEIRTPYGNEYDPSMANSIRRRYCFTLHDGKMSATTHYTIDGKIYTVNSVFDLINTQNCDEGLKRLMVDEANKVS